ncbi:FMN-dependent NADH-azoreductase [Bosea sp. (in: a-proteobacteria)]|jgi:FMN-dependent NADH-azoreductase|uniref:FMN-dependent NADH-azoreductase n=1 Tax=Bosea sp. (in: a-proteobacteria) TaxID=1871050 RepID=UPI002DDDB260|nr:NAD(P)H-dependent oxidoreductase [Bosea sp. (in: a-proteobacteria)]HEV2513016.1 NAD(P)H-dependent oxidoreductase [Bosea sp. (in: a-proteobacteria)]
MQPLNILQIDASARPGLSGIDPRGSHTRRLTRRFIERWQEARPQDSVAYRDVGQQSPSPVSGDWIAAAFTRPERRDEAARACLAESDVLVQELLRADLIVIGAPMYNFGLPAQLKAWVDNVVRVGVTFGFDRSRQGEPYWPMLPAGKRLVILSSRGDYGYDPGGRLGDINLVERGLTVPMGYIGLTETHSIAIEYDEFADERLRASISAAEAAVDDLVGELALNLVDTTGREPLLA